MTGRVLFGLILITTIIVRGQTNAATAPPANDERNNPLISFLTPAQQDEYAVAHGKALQDNPALKADGEKILAQGKVLLRDGSAGDKKTWIEMMNAHRQKLRQAMLKEDAQLGPIFAEIDQHLAEAKAKQLGQVQGSNSPIPGSH